MASIVLRCSTSEQSPLCSGAFLCSRTKKRHSPAPLRLLYRNRLRLAVIWVRVRACKHVLETVHPYQSRKTYKQRLPSLQRENGSRPQDVCQRRSMFDLPFRLKHRIIYGSTHHCNCPHNRGNIESTLSSWQQPGCRAFIAGGILPRALVRSVGEMGWTQNAAIPEAAGACVPCPEIQLDETGPSCYNSGKLERTAHPPGARKRHAGNTNLR